MAKSHPVTGFEKSIQFLQKLRRAFFAQQARQRQRHQSQHLSALYRADAAVRLQKRVGGGGHIVRIAAVDAQIMGIVAVCQRQSAGELLHAAHQRRTVPVLAVTVPDRHAQ